MKSDKEFIHHIYEEIKFIIDKTNNLDYESFMNDEVYKRAFLRSIEIIGEASNKLSDSFKKKYDNPNWIKLVSTRNRLIHGYFIIDYEIIWDILKNKIPILKNEIEEIIEKEKTLFD